MEKNEVQEAKTFVVNINLTQRLVALLTLVLLTAAFLGYLAWGQEEAVASNPQAPLAASTGLRQYYITTSHHNGADADAACASGYHMASLWEILDTANLEYNTALGGTEADSGQGPPTCSHGWVRTGYYSDNSNTPGVGNCNGWTSSDGSDYGTVARLPCDWTQTQDVHVWQAWTETCDWPSTVWCVAD
jgi:hypothetical protein